MPCAICAQMVVTAPARQHSIPSLSVQKAWIAHLVAEPVSTATLRTRTATAQFGSRTMPTMPSRGIVMPKTAARPYGQTDAGTCCPCPSVDRIALPIAAVAVASSGQAFSKHILAEVCPISAGLVHIPGGNGRHSHTPRRSNHH